MPSSFVDSFAPIVKTLIATAPRRVLDIGPGWGKYGLACREYLPDLEQLDAIEVPRGRMLTQTAIYDRVFITDARLVRPRFFSQYDLVLLVDVIEHMTLEQGHQILTAIQQYAAPLVATPKVFFEQHDERNPYEKHLSLWTGDDLCPHGINIDASTIDATIYLLNGPNGL